MGRLQIGGRQSEGVKGVEGTGREEEERRAGGRDRQGGRNEGKQGVKDKEGGIRWDGRRQCTLHQKPHHRDRWLMLASGHCS